MTMPFDRSRLTIRTAISRPSRVWASDAKEGIEGVPPFLSPDLAQAAEWVRGRKGPSIWFLGGHVFKANVGWYLKKLLRAGRIGHMATNGAGLIHDWELAWLGHTSEDVPAAIKDGSFGLWEEVGRLNDAIASWPWDSGIGTAAASEMTGRNSVLSAALAQGSPPTVHVAIGQDVVCEHPNYDGSAWGRAGYADFLAFAAAVEKLQGGTLLCFGSAVTAPEVFLKALAMVRNANGGKPDDIAAAVFDCVLPPTDSKDCYFNRPAKTLLGRVSNQAVFVHGRHEDTIPNLWRLLET